MKKHSKVCDLLRYAWARYVRKEEARIVVMFRDGHIQMKDYITKGASERNKVAYWAAKGILLDVLQMTTSDDQSAQQAVGAMAAMAILKHNNGVLSFSVPESVKMAVQRSMELKTAGVIPPCGKQGECSPDECKTCLQNPNLPTDDVTLGSLTKGAKF